MADDKLQDDDLVKAHLRNHDRLATLRAPWESIWQEIDQRVNPLGAGGFTKTSAGVRGAGNFDVTAVEGLDRFCAAMAGITTPRNKQYIRLKFADTDLDKLPEVRRWCERAANRLYAIRYAPHAAFEVQSSEDFRQLGSYGTGPLWTGEKKGVGLFYKALHLSECYIDEDFSGRVDTVHRKYEQTARQCEQEFGTEALTGKMRDAIQRNKLEEKFELLHVVCPNGDLQPDALDRRAMGVDSITVALGDKCILRRKGYHSMPISVSRHVTGPGDFYGRSPAIKVLPTIKGLNQMQQTILRAAHKAVDPALAFYNDDGVTSLITKPSGANPGLVNQDGKLMVARMPGGEGNLPLGFEMVERERAIVKTAFLEDYFKLLTEDSVQRSATAVLEIAAKQGILVAPYAGRYESEKQNPVTQRDLDLAMRAGQVEPFPPVVLEAGAYPQIEYENPLSRMARAESAAGLTRLIETLAPMAQTQPDVFDVIDADAAAAGVADVLAVPQEWMRTPEAIAARRKARTDAQAAQQGVEQLATAAGAYKDLASGNAQAQAA